MSNEDKPESVPAFADMDDEEKAAHLTERHHEGTTEGTRHFMTHLVGIVPEPAHVHAKESRKEGK